MKTLRIKFTDFSTTSFDPQNHWIKKTLEKRYKVELSDTPDFLFYSTWGYELLKYPNAVRVFCGGEPISPNFNDCDYAFGFEPIVYNDRYFQYPVGDSDSPGLYDTLPSIQDRSLVTPEMADRKFCNFVASQDWVGRGAVLRKQFCQTVMDRYKHVDCPGFVLHNLDNAIAPRWSEGLACGQGHVVDNWHQGKLDFIKNYKFTIAFENCAVSGLTTEKLIHPFQTYSIPIYWGNPDVTKIANPKAFINCNDYENDFDAIIEEIKRLDNDRDAYLEMLSQPPLQPDFDYKRREKAEEFLFHIIERGNRRFDKDSTRVARSTLAYEAATKPVESVCYQLTSQEIANSFVQSCYDGNVGMRYIMRSAKGWLKYKLRRADR